MARKSKKKLPSPVLWPLAEYYIHPDVYGYWEGEPLEFKEMIKNYLIDYINRSVEPYVESLPFLRIKFPENMHRKQKHVLEFDENLKGFLNTRKIARVTVWNIKGFKGDLVPLTSKEIKKRTGLAYDGGGFEIGLGYEWIQPVLTTFSHEIGHTYFYDLSKDPPKCLVPNDILETTKWHREFEGVAFDLGREVLLPRKSFTEYVLEKHSDPSVKGFLEMSSELKVSKAVLSQRLLKDLKLWRACIFWGEISLKDHTVRGKKSQDHHIFVRDRDKRKSFPRINIKKGLINENSNLRKTILERAIAEKAEAEVGDISIDEISYKFDMKVTASSESKKWFIALLWQ